MQNNYAKYFFQSLNDENILVFSKKIFLKTIDNSNSIATWSNFIQKCSNQIKSLILTMFNKYLSWIFITQSLSTCNYDSYINFEVSIDDESLFEKTKSNIIQHVDEIKQTKTKISSMKKLIMMKKSIYAFKIWIMSQKKTNSKNKWALTKKKLWNKKITMWKKIKKSSNYWIDLNEN